MVAIPLIALRTLRYAGRLVLTGHPFTASSEQDARILIRLGRAKKPSTSYLAASLTAQDVAEMSEDEPRKKRTYRRRDLTVESPE